MQFNSNGSGIQLKVATEYDTIIKRSEAVKNLPVRFTMRLSFDRHIHSVFEAQCFHILALRRARKRLPDDVAFSIVTSRFRYCDAINSGTQGRLRHGEQRGDCPLPPVVWEPTEAEKCRLKYQICFTID